MKEFSVVLLTMEGSDEGLSSLKLTIDFLWSFHKLKERLRGVAGFGVDESVVSIDELLEYRGISMKMMNQDSQSAIIKDVIDDEGDIFLRIESDIESCLMKLEIIASVYDVDYLVYCDVSWPLSSKYQWAQMANDTEYTEYMVLVDGQPVLFTDTVRGVFTCSDEAEDSVPSLVNDAQESSDALSGMDELAYACSLGFSDGPPTTSIERLLPHPIFTDEELCEIDRCVACCHSSFH